VKAKPGERAKPERGAGGQPQLGSLFRRGVSESPHEYLDALAGLIVGFVVGMTGMGGGALMTPVLILVFGVSAPAAVSSDLVASVIMRPVGAAVHLRRGTVQGGLVLWLSIGSVPMAFVGVLLIKVLAHGPQVQNIVELALGAALLVSAGAMVLKALINLRQRARGEHLKEADNGRVPVRRVPTLLIGALGVWWWA